jgi:hypothetical protein
MSYGHNAEYSNSSVFEINVVFDENTRRKMLPRDSVSADHFIASAIRA